MVGWDFFYLLLQTHGKETVTARVRSRQNGSDINVRSLVTGQGLEEEVHVV